MIVIKEPTAGCSSLERSTEISETVATIIRRVREEGDSAVRELSQRFDDWSPESFRLHDEEVRESTDRVPEADIEAISFSLSRFSGSPGHRRTL